MSVLTKLPFFTRKYIEALKLFYRSPKAFFLLKQPQNISNKTLIISFPRSGSSWVGAILGSSETSLYLREPVTTSYMLEKPNRISVFQLTKCQNITAYNEYVKNALAGNAIRANTIYKYPTQIHQSPDPKHLVIKEVNPLTLNLYSNLVDTIIYLVRHPYSVALSYHTLNWQSQSLFTQRFEQTKINDILMCQPNLEQRDFWHQMGYLLGWVEAKTKVSLTSKHKIVRYEDICSAPEEQFKTLCEFTELNFSETLKNTLIRSISGKQTIKKGDFSLQRNLNDVSTIKIALSDKPNHDKLISAYLLACKHFNEQHQSAVSLSYQQESPFIKWTND